MRMQNEVLGMDDKERHFKIAQTGMIVALTGESISCGSHVDGADLALALSVVAVILLLASVTITIWRSDA